MSPTDHYALSLRCRHKAEQELDQNDLLTAAEMMWGAAHNLIQDIVVRNNLLCDYKEAWHAMLP